jgi:peroxiredoxin
MERVRRRGGWAKDDMPSALSDARLAVDLVGVAVPGLTLDSTAGPINLAHLAAGPLVLFVYPHATGLPDAPVSDWDLIPGARGCTAEACGFRDHRDRLRELGAEVAGLSVQTVREQQDFAARVGVHFRLISDPRQQLAATLGLPTFSKDAKTFYRRLTLLARDGRIVKVWSPVADPERHAADVADWVERTATS